VKLSVQSLYNHLVEAALDAANLRQDLLPFEDLLAVISRPYDERPELEKYSTPARPEEHVLEGLEILAQVCGIERRLH
jgi:uncharacterized protein YdiU (UPF0061 family)